MTDDVRIKFRKAPSYQTSYLGGAWGGATPTGDIWVDFYYDHMEQPEQIALTVGNDGVTETERQGGNDYIRELAFGGPVRKDVGFSIGRWFLDKAYEVNYSPDQEELEWMEKRLREFRERIQSSEG